ncbi:hypothetical protein LZ30DRAFT_339536 [Colletotrichum cereale]|nr:hypothetical protein LZ30DRAFT_339536 [Colletotrichum cereale]
MRAATSYMPSRHRQVRAIPLTATSPSAHHPTSSPSSPSLSNSSQDPSRHTCSSSIVYRAGSAMRCPSWMPRPRRHVSLCTAMAAARGRRQGFRPKHPRVRTHGRGMGRWKRAGAGAAGQLGRPGAHAGGPRRHPMNEMTVCLEWSGRTECYRWCLTASLTLTRDPDLPTNVSNGGWGK